VHDLDKMMTYLSDDSVMIDVASPLPLDSKEDVRKLYAHIFESIDVHFEITSMIEEGTKVFAALRTTGKGKGVWAGKNVKGAPLDIFEAMYCETNGKQITRTMFYSDTASLSKQMGGYSPVIDMTKGVKNVM
jgi:predicted ester cyclase